MQLPQRRRLLANAHLLLDPVSKLLAQISSRVFDALKGLFSPCFMLWHSTCLMQISTWWLFYLHRSSGALGVGAVWDKVVLLVYPEIASSGATSISDGIICFMLSEELFEMLSEELHEINFWISDRFLVVAFLLLVPKSFEFFKWFASLNTGALFGPQKIGLFRFLITIRCHLINNWSLAEI